MQPEQKLADTPLEELARQLGPRRAKAGAKGLASADTTTDDRLVGLYQEMNELRHKRKDLDRRLEALKAEARDIHWELRGEMEAQGRRVNRHYVAAASNPNKPIGMAELKNQFKSVNVEDYPALVAAIGDDTYNEFVGERWSCTAVPHFTEGDLLDSILSSVESRLGSDELASDVAWLCWNVILQWLRFDVHLVVKNQDFDSRYHNWRLAKRLNPSQRKAFDDFIRFARYKTTIKAC